MPKTIAIDIRVLGTGRTSGVEEYTEQLLAHMIPLDPSVHYKLFYAGRRPLEHRTWMDAPNVTVYETGLSNRLLWARTLLTGRPYLDEVVGGADIFFFSHFLTGATSSQCRRVLTMHDLSFERFPELFSLGRRWWHQFQMRPRRQAAKADQVIAVSESTRRDLISIYGLNPDQVTTIHSGVHPRMVRASDKAIKVFRFQKQLASRYILMLGTIEPRKNIESVVNAFERLPCAHDDVELIIAGPRGWLWEGIVARAQHSPKSDRIRFVDEIDGDERALWLSAASLIAYPSFLEGFGFPPLEAMACGTPAIIGANSSMAEICADAAIAVNPYAVGQIQNALEALLDDSELQKRLVQRGSQRVKMFSWKSTAQKTLETVFSTLDIR